MPLLRSIHHVPQRLDSLNTFIGKRVGPAAWAAPSRPGVGEGGGDTEIEEKYVLHLRLLAKSHYLPDVFSMSHFMLLPPSRLLKAALSLSQTRAQRRLSRRVHARHRGNTWSKTQTSWITGDTFSVVCENRCRAVGQVRLYYFQASLASSWELTGFSSHSAYLCFMCSDRQNRVSESILEVLGFFDV